MIDLGRKLSFRHRHHALNPVGNGVRRFDDHLAGRFLTQVLKFFQHFLSGPKIQTLVSLYILKSLACHENPAVQGFFLIKIMGIAGGNDRFSVFFPQGYDFPVDFHQLFHIFNGSVVNQELVVNQRLNLQIIVKVHKAFDFLLAFLMEHRLVKLSRLAGRSDNKAFSVLFNHGFRHPRLFIKIVQVGIGNQFVQIFQSYPVLSQNNNVVGSLFLVVNGSVLANAVPVLQQIAFYPIEDLDVLSGMGSVGEGLYHAVVGDGDGFMPPAFRGFHQIFHIVEPVHGAHFRMYMQFYPLFRTVILTELFFAFFNALCLYGQDIIKGVPLRVSLDFDDIPGIKMSVDIDPLLLRREKLDAQRGFLIGNQKGNQLGTALNGPLRLFEQNSFHNHLSAFSCNFTEGRRLAENGFPHNPVAGNRFVSVFFPAPLFFLAPGSSAAVFPKASPAAFFRSVLSRFQLLPSVFLRVFFLFFFDLPIGFFAAFFMILKENIRLNPEILHQKMAEFGGHLFV